ncbi:2-C-methyl-D-erythritol 4-phosphate cytidylyltransferase [Actinopolymorpha cephalotaxi]|uniref:2-C-methyl-D-erythritol 4-phosphate cytidylyltransferase n=1 Tax=Actinopolymorpha cephalotaxi TaxID=504797 RepID=A0ABX2RZB4_9ACTN|nr:2-C-methyl-D-erythritol 4-phosphate cytidylyltransferase [Actinopolymorpha cephalotaxi]NYH82384.1 2-C-methyl-D-erythritol 4-phosphate cytidylyltransferase [Actinopolymorpha cephalotaxi]
MADTRPETTPAAAPTTPAAGEPLRSVGVVLAGGQGTRVGLRLPKQLLKVAGKPLLEHTLEVFETSPEIDEIVVLMAPGWTEDAEKIIQNAGFRKVTRVLEGGETRNDTTRRALEAVGPGEAKVLFHDAVRPLLDHRIIADCVKALDTFEAVDVAIPSADTIVVVDDGLITDIPSRARLRRGQTPQAFRLSTIRRAYEVAADDPNFAATDDCAVVLRYLPEVPITVVEGSERNMKVTYPIDVFLADQLFRLGSHTPPSPVSTDQAGELLAGRTLVVFGGSYGIGAEIGDAAREFGARVFSFSRSATGTHVEDPEHVAAALKQAYDESGRIDYVAVTAGVLHTVPLAEAPDDLIAQSLQVNLLGPVYVARAAHRYLAETGGHLLLFTSSSYTRGRAGYSLYSSTKAAVVNLTQALADEWAADGIQVNCVNPERTQTPMRTRAFGEEPPGTLLPARDVGLASLDVLLSEQTGNVVDVRRDPAPAPVTTPPGDHDHARDISTALEQVEEHAADDEVDAVDSVDAVDALDVNPADGGRSTRTGDGNDRHRG